MIALCEKYCAEDFYGAFLQFYSLTGPVLIHFQYVKKTGQDILYTFTESHTGLEQNEGE